MPAHAPSRHRRCKAKIEFFPTVTGKKAELNCVFIFPPGAAVRGRPPICVRALESSISRDPGETPMRPETERNIADIQQAIALLRRHL